MYFPKAVLEMLVLRSHGNLDSPDEPIVDRDVLGAVFVGYDLNGIPCHAHKRGTVSSNSYKGNVAGSQPEFSFHWHGTSDRIYLFEAPT